MNKSTSMYVSKTPLLRRVRLTLFWNRNKQNKNFVQSYWPQFLPSDLIESVQRDAMRIILPNLSYDQALVCSGLQILLERRGLACERFVQALQVSSSPCMARLLPERESVSHGYDLRSGVTRQCISSNRLARTSL